MKKLYRRRPAIAMIELIFAIVVIGITLISAPMLMQQATTSGYVTIQQEGVSMAASRVNMIMGFHWDEGTTDPTILDPILITSGDASLDEVLDIEGNGTGIRIGLPIESYRNFLNPDGNRIASTPSANLGSDAGDEDDMDDFAGTTILEEIIEVSDDTEADNIERTTISILTTVAYISDAPTTGTYNSSTLSFDPDFTHALTTPSNIKRISAVLTSTSDASELNKTITMHAFSCNIGGYQLEEKDF